MAREHKKQWDFLKKSVELGKLPHALLFYGQEKIGKKDLAMEFARFFIGQTNPPDFILIEPKNNVIQISQIRNLMNKLYFKPYLADYKLALIDKAELMNKDAQNCFLKFLEEPSDKTYLILITAYPSILLPTIISRVQKIRFFSSKDEKLDDQLVSDLLKIKESDLAYRFQYAKNVSKENLKETLNTWLIYLRKILINKLSKSENKPCLPVGGGLSSFSVTNLKEIIKQIQSTQHLLSTTNVNPKLALEILLMNI